MADVVILETTRGGKDPDLYYHVITVELADEIDNDDPWSDLGGLETIQDPRILKGYLATLPAARQWCKNNGYVPEPDVFPAIGY